MDIVVWTAALAGFLGFLVGIMTMITIENLPWGPDY